MKRKIRIGQIGVCHEHAAGVMTSLRLLPEIFDLVGVVDDRELPSRAKFVGDDFSCFDGLPRLTEEALFQIPGLQAVVVERPNLELVETALRCARRNLAIHMDKPGGDALPPFLELLEECRRRNLPFQMGYMFRANPAMQWCLRAVRAGYLGGIFEVQAAMSHNYGGAAYQEYLGKFTGGILFNLGCHLIDFVTALLGRPSGVTPFLKSAPGYPAELKNNGLVILEYPHATATLRACSLECDGLERRRLKICGTNGSIELCPLECFDGRPLQLRLVLAEAIPGYAAGAHTLDFGVMTDRYAGQLTEFAGLVRGELENPYSLEHDALTQEILLAAAGKTIWR